MEIIARELPRLNIAGCYLSLYEDPQSPTAGARLVLAYNKQGQMALEDGGRRFPSHHLVPADVLPVENAYSLVVEPLYFRKEQLGFAVFEAGPAE